MTETDYPATIKISGNFFKDRMKKLKPFMSTEETRYYLNGAYLEFDGETLKATATNGHILSQMTIECQHDNGKPFAVICPRQSIDHVLKIIGKGDVFTIHVALDGRSIRFDFADHVYMTKTIDGTYPDYGRVIPEGKVKMRECIKAEYLLDCLKALGNVPVDMSVDKEEEAASLPHLLTSQEAAGIVCVVMPMRV